MKLCTIIPCIFTKQFLASRGAQVSARLANKSLEIICAPCLLHTSTKKIQCLPNPRKGQTYDMRHQHYALEAINKACEDVFKKRLRTAWLVADDWSPGTKGNRSLRWKLEDTLLLSLNLRRPAVAHAAEKKKTVVTCGNYLLFRIQVPGFICLWGSKSNGKVENEKLWFCISTAPPIACFTTCLRQDRVWEIETEETKMCKVRLCNCTKEYILCQHIRRSGAVMHHTFHMNICLMQSEYTIYTPWLILIYHGVNSIYTACILWMLLINIFIF